MKKLMLHKADSREQIYDQRDGSYGQNPIGLNRQNKQPGFRDGFANNSAAEIASANQLQLNQGRQPKPNIIAQHSGASSTTNVNVTGNNSKIAAGPLSGNEASQKGGANPLSGSNQPIRLNEEEADDGSLGPSETDEDDDEHLDLVHDIHNDGEEADVEEMEGDDDQVDYATEQQIADMNDETLMEQQQERPIIQDLSMDGDIEDADEVNGQDTDRITKRPSLFNKLSGAEQQSSVDSDHHFKKKTAPKQFPLNQMRRRQSGTMGNQIQINSSSERPNGLANSMEGEKQVAPGRAPGQAAGGKGLFSGQKNKIKLNSAQINHNQNATGFARLNSDNNVVIGNGAAGPEASMRNSHYQPESSAYTWSQGIAAGQQPAANPPRSRQETDFRRKTLQNFNTRSNKALGNTNGVNQRTAQPDKMILPLRGDNLEHSPYQKDRPQQFSQNQPYQANGPLNHPNKFSKSSTRKSSNNLNLQQMSFQSGAGGVQQNIQNSKRVRESQSQSQSPSMLGIGSQANNHNPNVSYKNNSGGNSAAIRQFMKGNLKNQQQQQTNSGYPPATNSYIGQGGVGPINHKTNLNRLAFTANNFYDSRNMLGGVQQYGMRPSQDSRGNQVQQNNPGANGGNGQAMSRQSRSRQKIMKTNTYGVQAPVTHSPGQNSHQNSFGAGVQHNQAMQQSPYDNAALPMVEDFYGQQQNNMARNTFYVSDDQRQKGNLFKDLNAGKMHQHQAQRGVPNGNHYFAGAGGGNMNQGGGNNGSRQVQRVIWNGPGAGQQQTNSNKQLQNQDRFNKPRAHSRQADAHIKIEVHRDIKIRNYLQNKQTENMNLMFYDFNGSSFGSANNTAQNFYKAGEQIQGEEQENVDRTQEVSSGFRMNFRAEGDRVPTRERGYRSANQNMRRRDLHKKNIQNLQGGAGANTMSSVNETVAEHPGPTEHDMMIPQGL